jgi:hypothetical protein
MFPAALRAAADKGRRNAIADPAFVELEIQTNV